MLKQFSALICVLKRYPEDEIRRVEKGTDGWSVMEITKIEAPKGNKIL